MGQEDPAFWDSLDPHEIARVKDPLPTASFDDRSKSAAARIRKAAARID